MDVYLAKQQVERLFARVSTAVTPYPDSPLKIVNACVSVGAHNMTTVGQQLRQTDEALYRAKANGKNHYEFSK